MMTSSIKSFTLIETLVAILIFALAMGAASGLIIMGYRTYSYTWQQSIAIDEARRGIEIMVREMRQAQVGEDGSFPVEKAGDKEFIFYSDVDKDGQTEKIRYFLGTVNSGTLTQECQTAVGGGSCTVNFSNFFTGTLKSVQVKVYVDGDLDSSNEYVSISADGTVLINNLCQTGCIHCAGAWQGTATFDVMTQAQDNSIQFRAQASSRVGKECPSASPDHSMKARFELSWTEEIIGVGNELKKELIEPVGIPVEYHSDQKKISIITSYVRNAPPIFEYFDADGNQIEDYPARLKDTKMMKVSLVVNVDPDRPPNEFELESMVQLRNLKEE
jgi:type II secretory pathway pseudopilin PulG